MFGVNGVLATIGAKKIVFIGENQVLINSLRDKFIDVLYLNNVTELFALLPLPDYELIIEEDALVDSNDDFDLFFAAFESNVLVILNVGGNALSAKLKIETQGALDRKFLNAGYMLHESNMTCDVYNYRADKSFNLRSLYRKIAPHNLAKYSEQFLLDNRELHMDMLREPGARSDCHVVRYFLASTLIRKGDSVLDCACGLGYGSSIMAKNSLGTSYLGIDIEPSSIEYANNMYATENRLNFKTANAEDLSFIEDDAIDFISSFETIEHVPDYYLLLQEYYRVLSPGGRMIISAPNMWVDETGKDPNPYHFHEFDYEKLVDCVKSKGFLLEKSYLHTAPGGPTNFFAKRGLREVELGPNNISPENSDWVTLVVIKSPFAETLKKYNYTAYDNPPKGYVCTNFTDSYKVPWIYRSIVQIGERVSNASLLLKLVNIGLSHSITDKDKYADYGSCLTVKGYFLLESGSIESFSEYIEMVSHYIESDEYSGNMHVYRWKISAAFVAAKIAVKIGMKTKVTEFFNYIVESTPEDFSPLLMTKKINVLFYLGIYTLQDNQKQRAKEYFSLAINCGYKAISNNGLNSFGSLERPNSFGFSELAEVSDMTQQCVIALNEIDMFYVNAGYFWTKIDIKRFGLFSYVKHLEAENIKLKPALEKLMKLEFENNKQKL